MNFPRQLQLLVTSSKASTSRSYSVASKARKVRTPPHQPTAPRTPSTTTTAPLSAIPPLPASPSTPLASSDAFKTSSASPFSSDKGKARDDTPWYDLSKKPWEEPPLVAAARGKSVKQRSVWESYLVLPAKTRLYFSLGLFAVGLIGLYAGDWLVPESPEELAVKEGETLPVLVSTGAGAGEVGASGRV